MALQFRMTVAVDMISHFMEVRGDSFTLNKLKRWGVGHQQIEILTLNKCCQVWGCMPFTFNSST